MSVQLAGHGTVPISTWRGGGKRCAECPLASGFSCSCCSVDKREKLSLIEDRGQTDRVTALPRPYALDIDL